MFDNDTFGSDIIRNPETMVDFAYRELQARWLSAYGQDIVIADPNNAAAYLFEFGSSATAQLMRAEDQTLPLIYPARATTSKQLWPSISGLQYLNVTASPAEIQFRMILNADEIRAIAVDYDDNYQLVEIPASTAITLGDYVFGLYYPIRLMVNRYTSDITILYDIESVNPLKSYTTNQLDDSSVQSVAGLSLVSMIFKAYQFKRVLVEDTIDTDYAYSKTISFTDQFYALRIYLLGTDGVTWSEISYVLSSLSYDTSTPTAVVTVLEDDSSFQIQIPQVYFTNNMIGSRIRMEIYTTKGSLNVNIPESDIDEVTVVFDTSSSPYAAPLSRLSTCEVQPWRQTMIVGGSDALSFADMKKSVVNHSNDGSDPILNIQFEAAIEKLGFSYSRPIDNITNRQFVASAPLVYTDSTIIASGLSSTILTGDVLAGSISTIKHFPVSDTLTILPTTYFDYNRTSNTSVPVTDDVAAILNGTPSASLATLLNQGRYTRQPFHVLLDMSTRYPQAISYDLMHPDMENLVFVSEHPLTAAQFVVTDITVAHLDEGTGGYVIQVAVSRYPSIEDKDPSQLCVLFNFTTLEGAATTFRATYAKTVGNIDVFLIPITTTYELSTDGEITINLTDANGNAYTNRVSLSSSFDIRLGIPKSWASGVGQVSGLIQNVSEAIQADYLIVANQTTTINFGQSLETELYNTVTTTWAETEYKTYPSDVYVTNTNTIFATDATGVVPVNRVNSAGGVDLVTLFTPGSTSLDFDPINLPLTQSCSVGDTTLSVSSTATLLDGMSFSVGSHQYTITVKDATTVNVSPDMLDAIPAGTKIIITNSLTHAVSSAAQDAVGDTITLNSVLNIYKGSVVVGFGVDHLTVTDIQGTTITLSAPTTEVVAKGAIFSVYNPNSPGIVRYAKGTTMLDGNGEPIEVSTRTNTYGVKIVHVDARLFLSTDTDDQTFANNIGSTIVAKAQSLDELRPERQSQTYVTYAPSRTFGNADFNVGNNTYISNDLEIGISVGVYLIEAASRNDTLKQTITAQIQQTASAYVGTSSVVSFTQLAANLKAIFGNNATAVSVVGKGTLAGVATFSVQDPLLTPSIGRVLTYNETTNSMTLNLDIDIGFYLSTDAVTS